MKYFVLDAANQSVHFFSKIRDAFNFFHKNTNVHIRLEIALSIPALNELKIEISIARNNG